MSQNELREIYKLHAALETGDPLTGAFPGRRPLMPWGRDKAVEPAQVDAVWHGIMDAERVGPTAAYVHIPFCSTRCLFCGFYLNATRKLAAGDYAGLLVEELEREAERRWVASASIQAVYLGGGTPTDLDASSLSNVLRALWRCLPLAPDCEVTVEGRLWGFDDEKYSACLEAGATRFSFGVQSFDTRLRQELGRKLDGDAARKRLAQLCSRQEATVVADLIYGLPGQAETAWQKDVETAAGLGLDGVDLYCYSRIPGSPLDRAVSKGSFPQPPPVARQAQMFSVGHKILLASGWQQISSAHFSRGDRERNVYNRLTKGGAHVLPYGSGAGGSAGRYSFHLSPQLASYSSITQEGRKPIQHLGLLPESYPTEARITAAIESGVLNPVEIEERGCKDFARASAPLIRQWEKAGLLKWDGHAAILELAGRFWHTNLSSGLHAVARHCFGEQIPTPRAPSPPTPTLSLPNARHWPNNFTGTRPTERFTTSAVTTPPCKSKSKP